MPKDNLTRMIQLAEEFFDVQNDPEQIQVNERILSRLKRIHPSCVSQKCTRGGPVAWALVIPTSRCLMELFINKEITERELLRRTHVGKKYNAVYLCSVLVLPEYRKKGIAGQLLVQSIKSIQKQHKIKYLFYWPFGHAGEKLAETVAVKLGLPLFKKGRKIFN